MCVNSLPKDACYGIVSTGTCSTPSCPHEHRLDNRLCAPCNDLFPDAPLYNTHLQSTQHENVLRHLLDPIIPQASRWCDICRQTIVKTAWASHHSNSQHIRKSEILALRLLHLDPELCTPAAVFEDSIDLEAPPHDENSRRKGKKRPQAEFLNFEATRSNAPAVIQGNSNFGVSRPSSNATRLFVIKANKDAVVLIKIELQPVQPGVSTSLPCPFMISGQTFPQGVSTTRLHEIQISFQPKNVGHYEYNLEATFREQTAGVTFLVVRKLIAIVEGTVAQQKPVPATPNTKRPPKPRQAEKAVTAGADPPSLTVIPYKFRLPPARIPAGLASAISQGAMSQVLASVRKSYLPSKFGNKSYSAHFKVLLWVEEAKAEEDMLLYDMMGVSLEPHKGRHWLEVPGLAEKRPSVMLGDRILIRRQSDKEGHWFEGRVWDVQQLRVDLQLPGKAAKITAQNRCDVRFKLNRIPLQRQHQALDITGIPERVTFPRSLHVFNSIASEAPTLFANPQVGTNLRQREAVSCILSRPPGSVPFVIFGPPGTGKTVTVVEAISQLLRRDANARILACAPSNPAADIIARRLMHLGNAILFRFYAPSRLKQLVDGDMLPFTFTHKDGPFSVPPLNQLMAFRVVVTTCVSGSVPFGVGVPSGHFTHIFIDEAGQATEPEAMVPIRTTVGERTNIILSGDPKQLGPVIRSGVARELGLGKSYLERLMEDPLYGEAGGLNRNIVKLNKNFRSHNAILKFPNDEFYKGELEACGNATTINRFINSTFLPTKGKRFPIVFYAVPGRDERESTSPSFFNIHEITAVKDYVAKLKAHGIADNDIGIVTPYRAQCQKIRIALKGLAKNIKVGSVEEFQGDERLVMIVSTVRSNENYLEYDARFTLGFVSSPRRFNVAVTRAKALLLVVGDSRVLSLDPLWRSFMNYVHINGGWRGLEPDWDTRAPVDQPGEVYAQRRREVAENSMAALNARLHSLNVEDDTAAIDRPPIVELE